MSREPSSSAHRTSQAKGGWSTPKADPPPPPPPAPKKKPPRIRVEPAKPKHPGPQPSREELRRMRSIREQVVKKLTTTTEALSDEERQIIRGYRLSIGGEIAQAEHERMTKEMGL